MAYITKGIGGFYYVRTAQGIVECKARGVFRKRGITPVAGDNVVLSARRQLDRGDPASQKCLRAPAGGQFGCAVHRGQHNAAGAQHAGAGCADVGRPVQGRTAGVGGDQGGPKSGRRPWPKPIRAAASRSSYCTTKAAKGWMPCAGISGGICALFAATPAWGNPRCSTRSRRNCSARPGRSAKSSAAAAIPPARSRSLKSAAAAWPTRRALPAWKPKNWPASPKRNCSIPSRNLNPILDSAGFTGCSHRSETGCAVRAAVEAGKISPSRYASYLALYEEANARKAWEP